MIKKRFPAPAHLRGFDVFVLAGAMMNLIVIALLVGYWLLH